MSSEHMTVHVTYPTAKPLSFWRRNRLSIWRGLFILAGYVCLIVNMLTGGVAWSIIVTGALMLAWIVLFYRPQVESTPIKKLCDIAIAVCLYLFLLDSVLNTDLSEYVVPIVFFGDLILIGLYFMLFFRRQKRNFLPLFELILVGLVSTLLALAGVRSLHWPMIVVGGVSLGLLILCFVFFRKPLAEELRKKFHT